MTKKQILVSLCTMLLLSPLLVAQEKPLDIKTALELALQHNPELNAAKAYVDVVHGEARQMGLLPNPEVFYRTEAARIDNYFDKAEVILGISQSIPIGGRTLKAAKTGELLLDKEGKRNLLTLIQVKAAVSRLFIEALYYQEVVNIQRSIAEATGIRARLSIQRSAEGEIIESEAAQVEIEHLREKAKLEEHLVSLKNSLTKLSMSIGKEDLQISSVAGNLELLMELPDIKQLQERAAIHPVTRIHALERDIQKSIEDELKSALIPDLKVDISYHRLQEFNENSFDVGLSVVLPLFDRNQGAIAAAKAQQRVAEAQLILTRRKLDEWITATHNELIQSYNRIILIRDEMIPRADKVLDTAEIRYEAGDISILELLIARRQASRFQLDYLEVLVQLT